VIAHTKETNMGIASKSLLGLVVGIFVAALASEVASPAAASPTVSGSIDSRPHAAATRQYAQDFSRGSGPVDYGYKSKKCKKSDKKCKTKTKPKSDTKG
jgi:hypothetical protein